MTELNISLDRLSQIILLAREYDEGLPHDEEDEEENHVGEAIDEELVEEHEYDLAYQELKGALENLNSDDLASLTALVWIGRETYDPEEYETALKEASELDESRMADYLIGTPLLAEYIEEGMTRLGVELEEV